MTSLIINTIAAGTCAYVAHHAWRNDRRAWAVLLATWAAINAVVIIASLMSGRAV